MLASVLLQFTPLRANLATERQDLRRAVWQHLRSYRAGLSVLADATPSPKSPHPHEIHLRYQVWRMQCSQSSAPVLSSTVAITDWFQRDGVDGRLLIVGNPGSGKTHTLLAMGEQLLQRTETQGPVPVLIDLSAWNGEPLDQWLRVHLWVVYRLCQPVANRWLQSAQLTLLLDGFDHLPILQQRACAKEIETLLRSNPEQTAILCCRRQVLENNGIVLNHFNSGLSLQPLTAREVKDYLFAQGCEEWWPQVKANKALQHVARFPLYLTLLVAHAPRLRPHASTITGKDALVQHLLQDSVDPGSTPAPPRDWATLRWLALHIANRHRSLRVDDLRQTWLPDSQRLVYRGGVGLALVLIFTLVGGHPGLGVAWGLAFSQIDLEAFPYTHLSLALASWYSLGLLTLVCLLPALLMGVVGGGVGVLILGQFGLGLPAFGWGGLVGAVLGWGLGLGLGLWGGLPQGIQIRQHPNQDIHLALRNSAVLFGLLALVLVLALVIPAVVQGQPPLTLLPMPRLRVMVAALISAYLWFSFALQHVVLRILLTQPPAHLPWAFSPWLRRWVQRRVLRQWGGDYGFLHDTLREALAKE